MLSSYNLTIVWLSAHCFAPLLLQAFLYDDRAYALNFAIDCYCISAIDSYFLREYCVVNRVRTAVIWESMKKSHPLCTNSDSVQAYCWNKAYLKTPSHKLVTSLSIIESLEIVRFWVKTLFCEGIYSNIWAEIIWK